MRTIDQITADIEREFQLQDAHLRSIRKSYAEVLQRASKPYEQRLLRLRNELELAKHPQAATDAA